MNNMIAALLERVIAVLVERVAGSYLTTIAGLLGIAATAVSQLPDYVPEQWKPWVAMSGVILAGVAAILGRDKALAAEASAAETAAGSTQKLGVLMLCVALIPLPWMAGCNARTVAQNIVNWTPALQSAVSVVDTTAAVLDPAAAPAFAAATVGFDAGASVVVAQAKAYLANPDATILQQLQAAVVAFQQSVNASILAAAKIVNPASQQHALSALNAVATAINTILGLVQSISSGTQVAAMAHASTIKLASVEPYLRHDDTVRMLGAHYGMSTEDAEHAVDNGMTQLEGAGF